MPQILSLSKAAKVLDLDRKALGELARRLNLPVRPVPGLPNSRGLSDNEVSIIRERLRPVETPESVPA